MDAESFTKRQILGAFTLVVALFPPSLCEDHRAAWSFYSVRGSPDPLWFIVWDPEGVEYLWEGFGGHFVHVCWVPGSAPTVQLVAREATECLTQDFGVVVAQRVADLEKQLRLHLEELNRVESEKAVLELDEVLTETYERRVVWPHASDCPG